MNYYTALTKCSTAAMRLSSLRQPKLSDIVSALRNPLRWFDIYRQRVQLYTVQLLRVKLNAAAILKYKIYIEKSSPPTSQLIRLSLYFISEENDRSNLSEGGGLCEEGNHYSAWKQTALFRITVTWSSLLPFSVRGTAVWQLSARFF